MNKFKINDRVWINIFKRYATIIAIDKEEYTVEDDYGFTGIFKIEELSTEETIDKIPYDRIKYYCMWCDHLWIFTSTKLGTDNQIKEWFENVQKEHLTVCKIYQILNKYKENNK